MVIYKYKGEIDKDKGQKGEKMEGMTDLQFKAFLKSILEILESSKDLEEAKSKIKALLNEIQQSLTQKHKESCYLASSSPYKNNSRNQKKRQEGGEMEKEVKSRGVKKGETPKWNVGRKTGVQIKTDAEKKNKIFFGYKYTQKEYDELKKIFEDYKMRNGLNSTEAVKKIILEKK